LNRLPDTSNLKREVQSVSDEVVNLNGEVPSLGAQEKSANGK
jgi:hypothetical protein